jgi:hypothetical protein
VVSGNHHNLYACKALQGDPYVHIAQSNNAWRENYLVCGKGINGLGDLKGKSVAMDDYDGHTGLNVWLYLRQHGLEEGRDVKLVTDPVKARNGRGGYGRQVRRDLHSRSGPGCARSSSAPRSSKWRRWR